MKNRAGTRAKSKRKTRSRTNRLSIRSRRVNRSTLNRIKLQKIPKNKRRSLFNLVKQILCRWKCSQWVFLWDKVLVVCQLLAWFLQWWVEWIIRWVLVVWQTSEHIRCSRCSLPLQTSSKMRQNQEIPRESQLWTFSKVWTTWSGWKGPPFLLSLWTYLATWWARKIQTARKELPMFLKTSHQVRFQSRIIIQQTVRQIDKKTKALKSLISNQKRMCWWLNKRAMPKPQKINQPRSYQAKLRLAHKTFMLERSKTFMRAIIIIIWSLKTVLRRKPKLRLAVTLKTLIQSSRKKKNLFSKR